MMTLEELKLKLEDRNLKQVAKNSGVSYETVLTIATGKNKNPSYNSVLKLINYLGDKNEQV